MDETEGGYREKQYASLGDGIKHLNKVLKRAYGSEVKRRKRLQKSGGSELVKAQRPFDLPKDMNSAPLCDTFSGMSLAIEGKPRFISTNQEIKVAGIQVPSHVFFINSEGSVVDPTFGQHLARMGTDPVRFRKDNRDLFERGIFVGNVQKAKSIGVDYFPNKYR
jgi:hypothetical protein